MAGLLYPFLALAVIGCIALLGIHVASLFGITSGFGASIRILGPGVFVVFVPAVLVMTRLTRDFKQKDLWRAALRGCPTWLRRTVWVVFGYSWAGFFLLPILYRSGMDSPASQARTMSAVLLTFYLVAAAVLYSATQVDKVDRIRRCLNGHAVSPAANYCEECGAPVATEL